MVKRSPATVHTSDLQVEPCSEPAGTRYVVISSTRASPRMTADHSCRPPSLLTTPPDTPNAYVRDGGIAPAAALTPNTLGSWVTTSSRAESRGASLTLISTHVPDMVGSEGGSGGGM